MENIYNQIIPVSLENDGNYSVLSRFWSNNSSPQVTQIVHNPELHSNFGIRPPQNRNLISIENRLFEGKGEWRRE